jgi:hypothetical protein
MKKINFFKYSWVMFRFCILCVTALCLSGCFKGPGETTSQIHQRQMRVINTSRRQMQDDIDSVFLLDKPGRLNDKVIR